MYTIATLHQLRSRLGLSATDTAEDARLLTALQASAAQIERLSGRHFCPTRAAVPHNVGRGYHTGFLHISDSTLPLDDDLLELVALTNGDGTSVPTSKILLLPTSGAPYGVLRLVSGRAFTWEDTPLGAVTVEGVWGWHDDWSNAWRDSADTVQDNPLSSSATTLTVNDADAADAAGESPRFQVGQMLRVEDEYLRVVTVNTATNALTVTRGVGGTTAVSHAQGTTVEVYQPAPDVALLAVRWAAWLFKEPDNRLTNIPVQLRAAISPFVRLAVGA